MFALEQSARVWSYRLVYVYRIHECLQIYIGLSYNVHGCVPKPFNVITMSNLIML